jgi:hypothetical protein
MKTNKKTQEGEFAQNFNCKDENLNQLTAGQYN